MLWHYSTPRIRRTEWLAVEEHLAACWLSITKNKSQKRRLPGPRGAYKRNELERFSRWVTDWEFREYAYHL